MKNKTFSRIIIGALIGTSVASLGIFSYAAIANANDDRRLAFVCYADGVLVEAWDDIQFATRRERDPTWIIRTKAGIKGYYVQAPGTSCWEVRLNRSEVIADDISTLEGG